MARKRKPRKPKPRIPLPKQSPKVEHDLRKEAARRICRRPVRPETVDE